MTLHMLTFNSNVSNGRRFNSSVDSSVRYSPHCNNTYTKFNELRTLLLVIRSVSDVLRAQSRFVKFVGGEAAGLTPLHILETYFGSEVRQ